MKNRSVETPPQSPADSKVRITFDTTRSRPQNAVDRGPGEADGPAEVGDGLPGLLHAENRPGLGLAHHLSEPGREPPLCLRDLRATTCPALARSQGTSVSYWATEASTLAISHPAGVEKSNPSFQLTRLTLRYCKSS